MKYALENIETLIMTELHPDVIQSKKTVGKDLSVYISIITAEKNLVKSMLKEEFISCVEEEGLELLVQLYQAALINMADDLIQSIRSIETFQMIHPKARIALISVYNHILQCIEELLAFIERRFKRFFNIDEKIPLSYKLLMQEEFRLHLNDLLGLYKYQNLDSTLADIMLEPFRKFVHIDSAAQVTYRELFYLKTLHQEFSEILLSNKNEELQINILDKLLYLNYNNHAFINYYIQIISQDLNKADSYNEEIERLAWWLKTIRQSQTKPESAYKSKDSSAKECLLNWIEEEMAFLEKKNQLNLDMPPHSEITEQLPMNIVTSLSVKQLALFTRLLVDTEVIKTDNLTELIANIAGLVKTERTQNISATNLRIKYYNIDTTTKNILKDWLFKMMDQLRKC